MRSRVSTARAGRDSLFHVTNVMTCLIALAFGACAGAPKPVPEPVPSPHGRASLAIERWAQALANDPADASREDVVGQIALIYRVVVAMSPRAGSAAGLATTGLLVN